METIKDEDVGEHIDAYGDKYKLTFANHTEWARVDKDNTLVHLDMNLCAKGPANAYTALAVGIWNAAIEAAAKTQDDVVTEDGKNVSDLIRELKR